jgi:hypothetical protein
MTRRRMYGLMSIVSRHGAWFQRLHAARLLRRPA